jgi:hypothetical protein
MTMIAVFQPQRRTRHSRLCSYAETEAHRYFVSRNTELFLRYGCSLNGVFVCSIGEKMYPLCDHHHLRVIQWHQETNPNRDLKCQSIWDFKYVWDFK